MKKCTKCELEKEEREFYKCWRSQRNKFYLNIYCKNCDLKENKIYREKNFELLNEKRRLRKNQKKKRIGVDPLKYKCRYILKNAVGRGKIDKPKSCEKCMKKPEKSSLLHAHHLDYTQPFLIKWLCRDCHIEEHRSLKK